MLNLESMSSLVVYAGSRAYKALRLQLGAPEGVNKFKVGTFEIALTEELTPTQIKTNDPELARILEKLTLI
jgi:hypothetical protein